MKGVYFIANNEVYELTIAFLNSFRRYNSSLPLCLIPFDSNNQDIRALSEKYDFGIYDNEGVLDYCDHISLQFHGTVDGTYRKLAAWEGPFTEFVYIDVDTVVLTDVTFSFHYLKQYDFLTSHSNMKVIRRFVWNDRILDAQFFTLEQINFAANTGFIVSKKGALSKQIVTGKLEQALSLKDYMELKCHEQAFLNFMIVTSERSYTSLFSIWIMDKSKIIPLEIWAGTKGKKIENGIIRHNGKAIQPLLIHWAGLWQPRRIDYVLFAIFKLFGIVNNQKPIPVFMPYKNIWKYYRNLQKN